MTLKFSVLRTRNIFQMTFLSTALFVLFAAPSHASEMRPSTPPGRPEPVRIESSVQVNQETVIKAAKAGREAYSQVLSPYAKISADVAKKAALERFPGTECKDVSLHAVRHNLVYLILVENSEVRHLVIVDAGNGKPLAVRSVSVRSHMTSARHI